MACMTLANPSLRLTGSADAVASAIEESRRRCGHALIGAFDPKLTSAMRRNAAVWSKRTHMQLRGYSGLMFAIRSTFAHFSVSAAMSFAKSAGEPISTSAPKSAMRALNLSVVR
jgi:hypothetical protein